MFAKNKVKRIIKTQKDEDAIIAIDNVLSPIFFKKPSRLTAEEKNIVYIGILEREVNNGGFSQFFWNSSGNYVEEISQALEAIGSSIFLRLVKLAIAEFPEKIVPKDRLTRQDLIETIEEEAESAWDDLDSEFFQCDEALYDLMIDYITRNIEKFR